MNPSPEVLPYLIASLALNGAFLLWLILRGPAQEDRHQLQNDLFRAHQEMREQDEAHRLGLSADRALGLARWDESFRALHLERVKGWQAEAERQGLEWLVPMKKGA